jgi:hypothetical protein
LTVSLLMVAIATLSWRLLEQRKPFSALAAQFAASEAPHRRAKA